MLTIKLVPVWVGQREQSSSPSDLEEVFWMDGSTIQTNFHTSQTFPPAVIVSPTSTEAGYWCDK